MMKRRFLASAALALLSMGVFAPGAAHAGGASVATAVCSVDGTTLTWAHIAEAANQALGGDIRTVRLLSVKTFEASPLTLTTTEISPGVWKIDPFDRVGAVVLDIELEDTMRPVGPGGPGTGPVSVTTSTPRLAAFTCSAPPSPPPTTLAPTTTLAPAEPVPSTLPAVVTTVTTAPLPTTSVAGTTTIVASGLLPETGATDNGLMLAGGFLLLTGCSMTLATQLRRRPL